MCALQPPGCATTGKLLLITSLGFPTCRLGTLEGHLTHRAQWVPGKAVFIEGHTFSLSPQPSLGQEGSDQDDYE